MPSSKPYKALSEGHKRLMANLLTQTEAWAGLLKPYLEELGKPPTAIIKSQEDAFKRASELAAAEMARTILWRIQEWSQDYVIGDS